MITMYLSHLSLSPILCSLFSLVYLITFTLSKSELNDITIPLNLTNSSHTFNQSSSFNPSISPSNFTRIIKSKLNHNDTLTSTLSNLSSLNDSRSFTKNELMAQIEMEEGSPTGVISSEYSVSNSGPILTNKPPSPVSQAFESTHIEIEFSSSNNLVSTNKSFHVSHNYTNKDKPNNSSQIDHDNVEKIKSNDNNGLSYENIDLDGEKNLHLDSIANSPTFNNDNQTQFSNTNLTHIDNYISILNKSDTNNKNDTNSTQLSNNKIIYIDKNNTTPNITKHVIVDINMKIYDKNTDLLNINNNDSLIYETLSNKPINNDIGADIDVGIDINIDSNININMNDTNTPSINNTDIDTNIHNTDVDAQIDNIDIDTKIKTTRADITTNYTNLNTDINTTVDIDIITNINVDTKSNLDSINTNINANNPKNTEFNSLNFMFDLPPSGIERHTDYTLYPMKLETDDIAYLYPPFRPFAYDRSAPTENFNDLSKIEIDDTQFIPYRPPPLIQLLDLILQERQRRLMDDYDPLTDPLANSPTTLSLHSAFKTVYNTHINLHRSHENSNENNEVLNNNDENLPKNIENFDRNIRILNDLDAELHLMDPSIRFSPSSYSLYRHSHANDMNNNIDANNDDNSNDADVSKNTNSNKHKIDKHSIASLDFLEELKQMFDKMSKKVPWSTNVFLSNIGENRIANNIPLPSSAPPQPNRPSIFSLLLNSNPFYQHNLNNLNTQNNNHTIRTNNESSSHLLQWYKSLNLTIPAFEYFSIMNSLPKSDSSSNLPIHSTDSPNNNNNNNNINTNSNNNNNNNNNIEYDDQDAYTGSSKPTFLNIFRGLSMAASTEKKRLGQTYFELISK
jgi:tRNA A37 threonylcarbamoyladenosine biosynthesis protein TsaE